MLESNNYGVFEILSITGQQNITIKFLNTGTIVYEQRARSLISGNIKDYYAPHVCKVGYLGVGQYKTNTHPTIANLWYQMMERCYTDKHSKHGGFWYSDVTVCDEWHNFQNFAAWCEKQHKEDGWHLDKDLRKPGNKLYSPDSCCMIPQELNHLLNKNKGQRGEYPIGVTTRTDGRTFRAVVSNPEGKAFSFYGFKTVESAFEKYKTVKSAVIKQQAEKWKDKLPPDVYFNLVNYEIKIDD